MRFFHFIGNCMAGALDVSVGMLIAALLVWFVGDQPIVPQLAVGVLLVLLPDFDIVQPIFQSKVIVGNHRETKMHIPLLVVPISSICGGFITFMTGDFFWLGCFFLCPLWHYLHDTGGWFLGNGALPWKWPYESTLCSFGNSLKYEEQPHSDWLEKRWLRRSPLSVKELSVGYVASGVAVTLTFSWVEGLCFAMFALLSTLIVWNLYAVRSSFLLQSKETR